MVLTEAQGLPLALHIASASPHEVTLVDPLLAPLPPSLRPNFLIADKAYDSDGLRLDLACTYRIRLVCPHREKRKKAPIQDQRRLRRYRRRYKVERSIAWLQNFRRVVVRYEYHDFAFLGFLTLAACKILMRYL